MELPSDLVPSLYLFAQGPRQTYFGVIDYNLLYRQSDWPHATRQNLEVLVSWIDSGPALLLILLALGGYLFVRFRADWEPVRKAELYLCAWLSAGLGVYIASCVRPDFERYFIFVIPFLSILATAGLFAAGSLLYRIDRPWVPAAFITFLTLVGLGRALYLERDAMSWMDLEITARKVTEVTAHDQPLFADEAIYFLTKHEPPSGMEMRNSHKFNFSPATLSQFHLIPQAELDQRVKAGYFATLETCEDTDFIDEHRYSKIFAHTADAGDCTVFWGKK